MKSDDILMMNCNLFKKMKELAERQEKLISEDLMDEFNSLSSQRENIKKEITANFSGYGSETKTSLRNKENQKIKTLSMEISDIIRSIQETDKRIEESIIIRKDALSDEIKNIRKGQNAVKRYGGVPKKITKFLDKKS
jgi:hypothetical protein